MTREERKIARSYERAYKRVLALFIVAIVLAIALTAIVVSNIVSRPVLVQTDEEVYFVEENDTLWDYANDHCPKDMDIRKYIQIIVDYNDKDDATLYVGEVIYLPIFSANKY